MDAHDAAGGAGSFYLGCGWADRGWATYRGQPPVYWEVLLGPAELR